MNLEYRKSKSTIKPSEIEKCKNTVYLRKDIVEEIHIDEDGNETVYFVYQEAKMNSDEFNEYSKLISANNAINGTNDSTNITNLVSGQENSDSNQLAIMEAIADLYDMISSNK